MTQISLAPEDLKCLSLVLSAALNEAVDIEHLEEVSKGANAKHHKKAILTSGRIIGLKAAERVRRGTVREFLLANTAKMLKIPGRGACGIFLMPDSFPLARMRVVALEWLLEAEQIRELNAVSDRRKSPNTANQLGQWIWLCLYFGVSDRGMQNWVWSESNATIAMIDYEDWNAKNQKPEALSAPVKEILMGSAGTVTPEQAKAFLEGMKTAKDSLAAAQGQLAGIFAEYGESHTSAYDGANVVQVASKITGVPEADLTVL